MTDFPAISQTTFIKASPEEVYDAIATAEGLDRWFTCGTEIEPRPGGSIRLRWKNFGAGRCTVEDGDKVVESEPSKRFVFTWRPGTSVTTVTIDLKPHADGTMLSLTEAGYTDDPDDIAAMLGCASGWGEALTILKYYLEYGVKYEEVPEV